VSVRCGRDEDSPCPVSISSLAVLHNVINKFKLKMTGASGNIGDSADFQKAAAGYFQYSQKYMQRVAIMKANPRKVPVTAGHDIFDINPALIFSKEKPVSSLLSMLGNMHDTDCGLTVYPFEVLYETRSSAAAAFNWKKITPEQLSVFQHLLRMEMQYLAGCTVEWERPAATSDAEDRSEAAAGQSQDTLSIIGASEPQGTAQGE